MQYTFAKNTRPAVLQAAFPIASMPRLDEEEDQTVIPFFPKQKPYNQYEASIQLTQIHYHINRGIGDPSEYADMVHRIQHASENDIIYLHLNTPGGQLDTGAYLLNAIEASSGHIVTILEGSVCSLGTLLFLAGDEMVVSDYSRMMFHNYRGGMIGNGQEMAAELKSTQQWMREFADRLYIPFLSEQEVEKIFAGTDLWLHAPEIIKRLKKMQEIQQAQAEEAATKKVRKPRAPKVTVSEDAEKTKED